MAEGPPIERGPWTGDPGFWINLQTGMTVTAGGITVGQVTGITFVGGTLTGNARNLQVTVGGGGSGLPPGGFLEQPLVNDGTPGEGEWSNTISARSVSPDTPPVHGATLNLQGEAATGDSGGGGGGVNVTAGPLASDDALGAYANFLGATPDTGDGAEGGTLTIGGGTVYPSGDDDFYTGGTIVLSGANTDAGAGGIGIYGGEASTVAGAPGSVTIGGQTPFDLGAPIDIISGFNTILGDDIVITASSGAGLLNGSIVCTINSTEGSTPGTFSILGLPAAVAGLPDDALWVDPATGCVVAAPGTGPSGGGGGWNNGNGVDDNVVIDGVGSWAAGEDNNVTGSANVVGGAGNNPVAGGYSGVFGVANQLQSNGLDDLISGVNNNVSGQDDCVVGENLTVSGSETAAFGRLYTSSMDESISAGDNHGTLSGIGNAVFGESNSVTGDDALVSGANNFASGNGPSISGYYATNRGIWGAVGFGTLALGAFGVGKGQSFRYGVAGITSDGSTPVVLTFDGNTPSATNQLALPNGQNGALGAAYVFTGQLVAVDPATGNMATFNFNGAIGQGATPASTVLYQVSSEFEGLTWVKTNPIPYNYMNATWVAAASIFVTFSADTTNGALQISVTGIAATTIQWMCDIQTSETTF